MLIRHGILIDHLELGPPRKRRDRRPAERSLWPVPERAGTAGFRPAVCQMAPAGGTVVGAPPWKSGTSVRETYRHVPSFSRMHTSVTSAV